MQLKLSSNIFLHYFLIAISFLGLCFLPLLTFNTPHTSTTLIAASLQRALIGLIFGGICFLGIMATIFPSRCSKILRLKRDNRSLHLMSKNNIRKGELRIRGHHPTCDNFSGHIIQVGGKTYCAGCLGMIIGTVIVLLGSLIYFSNGLYLKGSTFIFWLGFFGVAGGLLHYMLFNPSGIIRFLFNIMFVLGSFFILIGIDFITNNFVLDLYVLTLIIYWIIIRIMVSQKRHQKICKLCNMKPCSSYE